jgi:hypothetical protein
MHMPEGEEGCDIIKICKEYEPRIAGVGRKKTPAPYAVHHSKVADKDGRINQSGIQRMRNVINLRMKNGLLSEEQTLAFKNLQGIFYRNMNEVQRQQIADIYKESQPRRGPRADSNT